MNCRSQSCPPSPETRGAQASNWHALVVLLSSHFKPFQAISRDFKPKKLVAALCYGAAGCSILFTGQLQIDPLAHEKVHHFCLVFASYPNALFPVAQIRERSNKPNWPIRATVV